MPYKTEVAVGGRVGLREAALHAYEFGPVKAVVESNGEVSSERVLRAIEDALKPYELNGVVQLPGAAWVATAQAKIHRSFSTASVRLLGPLGSDLEFFKWASGVDARLLWEVQARARQLCSSLLRRNHQLFALPADPGQNPPKKRFPTRRCQRPDALLKHRIQNRMLPASVELIPFWITTFLDPESFRL